MHQVIQSCHCFCVELVKLLQVHGWRVDFFHNLVLREDLVLGESRIPLKSGLRENLYTFHNSHGQTQ